MSDDLLNKFSQQKSVIEKISSKVGLIFAKSYFKEFADCPEQAHSQHLQSLETKYNKSVKYVEKLVKENSDLRLLMNKYVKVGSFLFFRLFQMSA